MGSTAASLDEALARVHGRDLDADGLGSCCCSCPSGQGRRSITRCHEISANSDEQLLIDVQCGSKDALNHLFRRYARVVRGIAYRIVLDEGEADDLVQEVFLFILLKASLYRNTKGTAASWIIHLAYHRGFDRRRYLRSRNFYASCEIAESDARHSDSSSPACRSIEGTLGRAISHRLAACLSPEQRQTIQLFFFEGYTLKEISGRTGRSIVNVRSYYYRGLERLRKCISAKGIRST